MSDLLLSLSSIGAFSYSWNKSIESNCSCFVKLKNSIIAFLEALFCGYTVYESEVDETEIIKNHRDSFFGKEYRQFKDMRIKPHEQEYLKNKKHTLKEKREGEAEEISVVKHSIEGLEYLMMSKTLEASNPNFSKERIKLMKPKDCRRLFHSACALDRTEIALRLLLTSNCDQLTHFLTLEKEPILSFFARHNVFLGVRYLLDKDAIHMVNSTDLNNNTALMAAAKEGNTEILQMLLSAGAKCNMINNKGFMSLHYAAIGGHVECVRRLLGEEDIIVKAVNKYGYTPLYYAADGGHEACVKVLLSVDCGNGLLCLAAKKGHLMCLTMLLPEQNICLNKWNEFGSTPLHSAIDGDNVEGLSILLSTKGIDVNAIDELFGMTPLHYAIRNEKIACAKVILDAEGVQFNVTDHCGEPLLHSAASINNTECLYALLNKAGIQENIRNRKSCTPLHCATRIGNEEGIRTFMDAKDVNVLFNCQNACGNTPIHFAAKYGNKACLNVLLRIPSIDVNIINYGGNTALHIAATWGNVSCLERLLSVPCIKRNERNHKGLTPLQCAEKSVKISPKAYQECVDIYRKDG